VPPPGAHLILGLNPTNKLHRQSWRPEPGTIWQPEPLPQQWVHAAVCDGPPPPPAMRCPVLHSGDEEPQASDAMPQPGPQLLRRALKYTTAAGSTQFACPACGFCTGCWLAQGKLARQHTMAQTTSQVHLLPRTHSATLPAPAQRAVCPLLLHAVRQTNCTAPPPPAAASLPAWEAAWGAHEQGAHVMLCCQTAAAMAC